MWIQWVSTKKQRKAQRNLFWCAQACYTCPYARFLYILLPGLLHASQVRPQRIAGRSSCRSQPELVRRACWACASELVIHIDVEACTFNKAIEVIRTSISIRKPAIKPLSLGPAGQAGKRTRRHNSVTDEQYVTARQRS
jgi:hypothetical protein